jgi:hypothetical protein
LALLSWSSVWAHDINTASVVIKKMDSVWTIHLSFSRIGANYSMSEFLKTDLTTLEASRFKEKLVQYVRSNLKLSVDDTSIPIGPGGIKLGNHQTDLRFFIPDFPPEYEQISLSIPLFNENANQHTIVRFSDGIDEIRKVLSHANNFTFRFKLTPDGFVETIDGTTRYLFIFGIPLVGVLLWFIWMIFSKKKRAQI